MIARLSSLLLCALLPTAAAAGPDLASMVQLARQELDGVERGVRLIDQALEGSERLDDRSRRVEALAAAELDLLLGRPAVAAAALASLAEQPSLAGTPQRIRALALLARARAALGDPAGVQSALTRLLDAPGYRPSEPEFSELFGLWLDAAARSGELQDLDRLLALRDALRDEQPAAAAPSGDRALDLARLQLWRGDWNGALTALAERPARRGDAALARYYTGAALAGLGRLEDAAAAFAEAAFLYGRERGDAEGAARATLQRARVLADLGRYVVAAEVYRGLASDRDVGADAVRELGLMRLRQGRPALGAGELDAILEERPALAGRAGFGLVASEVYIGAGAEARADEVLLQAEQVEARRRDELQAFLDQPRAGERAAAFFRSRGSCLTAVDPDGAPPAAVLAALERDEAPAAAVAILDRVSTADTALREAEAVAAQLERRAPGEVGDDNFPLLATGRRYGDFLAGVTERLIHRIGVLRSEVEVNGPGFCPAAMRSGTRVAGPVQLAAGSGSPCLREVRQLELRAVALRDTVAERIGMLQRELDRRRGELMSTLQRELDELGRARAELEEAQREGESLLVGSVERALGGARDRARTLARVAEAAYRDRPWRSLLRLEAMEDELRAEYKVEIEKLRRQWSEAEK